jgi:hypothetical protein
MKKLNLFILIFCLQSSFAQIYSEQDLILFRQVVEAMMKDPKLSPQLPWNEVSTYVPPIENNRLSKHFADRLGELLPECDSFLAFFGDYYLTAKTDLLGKISETRASYKNKGWLFVFSGSELFIFPNDKIRNMMIPLKLEKNKNKIKFTMIAIPAFVSRNEQWTIYLKDGKNGLEVYKFKLERTKKKKSKKLR